MHCKYFLALCSLPFYFLVYFKKQALNFMKTHFISISFMLPAFCVLKKIFAYPNIIKTFFLCFFSRSFMVLASTMRPMIKLNFCGWCKLRVNVHFPPYG